jgi:hypothetical protein
MKKFRSLILREAFRLAGFREKFAMENGNRATLYINGAKCYKWTYNTRETYQDANGATFDTVRRAWIA